MPSDGPLLINSLVRRLGIWCATVSTSMSCGSDHGCGRRLDDLADGFAEALSNDSSLTAAGYAGRFAAS